MRAARRKKGAAFPMSNKRLRCVEPLMRQCIRWLLLVSNLIGSAAASAAQGEWEPVGLSGGGAMFAPAISAADPNLMMINCDMGAAYISEDGGHNWRMINHLELGSDTGCRPAFHPTDPNVIFASSGGRLRVSRDRGHTFKSIGNLREGLRGEIAIDPADVKVMLAGTHGEKSWLSKDAGVTWNQCNGPQGEPLHFFFDHASSPTLMFAATRKGIWRSDDGGGTWRDKSGGLPWKDIQAFAGGANPMTKKSMLYCSILSKIENGAFVGGVYRSANNGESWEAVKGEGLNKETKKADQYAFAEIAQYHQLLSTDADPTRVYAMNSGTGFHPPHHETVYRSDDAGASWRATYYQDPRFKDYNVEPDYIVASTGQSFKGGNPPFGVAICNSDPNRVLLVRDEAHVTHDGGTNWFNGSTRPTSEGKPKAGTAWICNGLVVTTTWHHYIDPFQANRHYICYTDIGFARSVDAGKGWIWWDKTSWAPWRNTCYELAFDPATPGKIWGAFSDTHDIPNDNIISGRHRDRHPGGLCISRDFAATWKTEAKGLPLKPLTSIVVDPKSSKESRTLYAGVFNEGVFKSSDDGKSWTLKKNGLGAPENMRVSRVVLHSDGTLFAMICAKRGGGGKPLMNEGVGLYRSKDAAENWEKVNASRLFLYPKDFAVDPRDSRRILIGVCDAGGGDQSGGLYMTIDAGTNWRRIGREGPQTFGGYFHPKQPGWIYMTLTEGAPRAGLWLSQDNGATWKPFNALPFGNVQRVEFDPADDTKIYLATFGGSIWHGPALPD